MYANMVLSKRNVSYNEGHGLNGVRNCAMLAWLVSLARLLLPGGIHSLTLKLGLPHRLYTSSADPW